MSMHDDKNSTKAKDGFLVGPASKDSLVQVTLIEDVRLAKKNSGWPKFRAPGAVEIAKYVAMVKKTRKLDQHMSVSQRGKPFRQAGAPDNTPSLSHPTHKPGV